MPTREQPLWLKILLNISGPLGVGLALLGYVNAGLGLIFLAGTVLYVGWEIYPSAVVFRQRRKIVSLVAFISVGAFMGLSAWALILRVRKGHEGTTTQVQGGNVAEQKPEQQQPQLVSSLPPSPAPPKPTYIPERNDYSCPEGWTPSGGWGKNGIPLDPNRPIGCELSPTSTTPITPPQPKKPESPVVETPYSVEIITAIMPGLSRDQAMFFSKWEVTPDGIEKVTPVPMVFFVRLENRESIPKRIVEWDLALIGSNATVVPTEIPFDAPMYLSSGYHVAFGEPSLRKTLEEGPIRAHDFVTGILLLDVPKLFNTATEQGPWKLRIGLRSFDDSKKYYAVSSSVPEADNLTENLQVRAFPVADKIDPSKWTLIHITDP